MRRREENPHLVAGETAETKGRRHGGFNRNGRRDRLSIFVSVANLFVSVAQGTSSLFFNRENGEQNATWHSLARHGRKIREAAGSEGVRAERKPRAQKGGEKDVSRPVISVRDKTCLLSSLCVSIASRLRFSFFRSSPPFVSRCASSGVGLRMSTLLCAHFCFSFGLHAKPVCIAQSERMFFKDFACALSSFLNVVPAEALAPPRFLRSEIYVEVFCSSRST